MSKLYSRYLFYFQNSIKYSFIIILLNFSPRKGEKLKGEYIFPETYNLNGL